MDELRLTRTDGTALRLGDLRGRPVLLVFLRWLGWVAWSDHLAQLRQHQTELDQLGVAVLAVTWERPERAAEYARDMHVDFPLVSDPDRAAYRAFGLLEHGHHSYGSPLFWWLHVVALFRGRLRLKRRGTLAQLGGDVILARDGSVAYRHASREPVDRPSADELLAALRRM